MNKVEPIRNRADLKRIEKILSKNPRDLLFFTIGTNCGLRISDILALNVGDVKGKNYIQLTEKQKDILNLLKCLKSFLIYFFTKILFYRQGNVNNAHTRGGGEDACYN